MFKLRQIKFGLLVIFLWGLLPKISLAQKSSLSNLILAAGANQVKEFLMGNTGGSYSLASIANQDSKGNPCLGYGDPEPDHKMILKSDFAQLLLQIDSGGSDTTLLIKGTKDDSIRCAYGQDNSRDAIVQGSNWSADTYSIWVGSMSPNQRSPYRLLVQS